MIDSDKMLSVFVFAAKRMVKGAATLTSFALEGSFYRRRHKSIFTARQKPKILPLRFSMGFALYRQVFFK